MKDKLTGQFELGSNAARVGFLEKLCDSLRHPITPAVAETIIQSINAGRPQLDALGRLAESFEVDGGTLTLKLGDFTIRQTLRAPYTVEITLPKTWDALGFADLARAQAALSACDLYARHTAAEDVVTAGFADCSALIRANAIPGLS